MEKVYMIWESDWGNTGIFFVDKNTAKIYCQLRNDKYRIDGEATNTFTYKEMELYDSMEDYKNNQKEIDILCKREAPDWDEIAPTIERCIYQDSLIDDEINESFRSCLREISIIK